MYIRDLSLTVKYETFNLCYMGSNPIGLKRIHNIYGHRLMVDLSSSKRFVSIRIRLAVIIYNKG